MRANLNDHWRTASPRRRGLLPVLALLAALVTGLPAQTAQAQATTTDICSRTTQVRDEILDQVTSSDCASVSVAELGAIAQLNLRRASITTLQGGDFDGLSSLSSLLLERNDLTTLPSGLFDDLSSLTFLWLDYNDLVTLPSGLFDNLSNLTNLRLSINDIATLPGGLFDNLSSLTFLDLSNNELTTLPSGVFDNLPNLDTLLFDINQISTLPGGIFDNLSSLRILNFGRNQISTLPDGVFDNLSSLTGLDLAANPIATLPSGLFDNLSSLMRLDLRNTQLSALPSGLFDNLSSLEGLDLGFNTLTLSSGLFNGLSSLTSLELDRNELTTLPSGVFDNLPNLETLLFDINHISTLPSGVFDNLSRLTRLEFDRNGISTLPDGVFDNLSSLENLRFDDNLISTLPSGVFDNLSSLEDLNFGSNPISTLPSGVFDNLSNLTTLVFWNNQISTLPGGIFDNLSSLRILNFGSNQISTLPSGVFDNLSSLTDLRFFSNQISTLPSGVFDNLSNLTDLWFSSNQISTLPSGVFDNLSSLTDLNFSDNQISTLPGGVFDNLASLAYLDLRANPFTPETGLPRGIFDPVLDTLGPIISTTPPFSNDLSNFVVDDTGRAAHFVCSRADSAAIVAATAGVSDCLRITAAQLDAFLAGDGTPPPASTDASLAALSLAAGTAPVTLSPAFDTAVFTYTAAVANAVAAVTVTATATDATGATIAGAGAINLSVGANTITITVTAEDGTTTQTYTVTVTRAPAVNTPPMAGAGPDQTVSEATTVTLDGSGSMDADGDALTYTWAQTAGPAVTLSGATSAMPTFIAPAVTTATDLTFSLTVNDGAADSAADTVVVTVNPAPTITGTTAGTAPQPADPSQSSTASGTVTVTPASGARPPAGGYMFTPQDDTSGTYGTFDLAANGAWNYETDPADGDFIGLGEGETRTETFMVEAGGVMLAVTITVTGINDAPVVAAPIAAQTAPPGGESIVVELDDVFNDPDTGAMLTFMVTSSDPDVATATVSSPLTITPVAQGRATITVTATDEHDATTTHTFPIEVAFGPGGLPDRDDDGVSDVADTFPDDPGEHSDADGDGIGDNADTDDDNDGVPDDDDAFPLDPSEQADADGDGIGDNADDEIRILVRQYLQTTSAGSNDTALHIVNTAAEPQTFTGSLYTPGGEALGAAEQPLGLMVAPNARLILDSGDLEAVFGVPPWRGPAMLEVIGGAGYSLMSRLTSPGGLVSNTNCVRESNVLNVEGALQADGSEGSASTYIRFINVADEPLGEVRGALYDWQGEVIGNRNALLLETLAPKAQTWLDRDDLARLLGAPAWTGEAMLVVSGRFPRVAGGSALKLLNLNLVADSSGGTFFNFSCFEDSTRDARGGYSRVYLQTTSTSENVSLTHVVNTSVLRQRFTGTLYAASGRRLGPANQPLHEGTVGGRARLVLSSADLEAIFGVMPWEGPAMLEVRGSEGFALMTKLRSPSGLVSNTNCARRGQVHNILGADSADRTFIRFINIGEDSLSNLRGTLYDGEGGVIGSPDVLLLASLAPKAQVWLDRDELADLAGDTWQGTASLVITPAPEDALASLRLLNLNLVNNETFFNFSCYEGT